MDTNTSGKSMRGFAVMTREKRSEIASLGGKAAHRLGTANKWTGGPDGTAAQAGKKGGTKSRRKPRETRA